MRLEGKTAVVTGGSTGMGAATARLFAREGASITILDVNDTEGQAVADDIKATYIHTDISDSAQVEAAFAQVLESSGGRIDAVVHAAAIDDLQVNRDLQAGTKPSHLALEMPDEQWRKMMSVNLDGAFFVLRAALRAMVPHQAGSIVMISSLTAINGVSAKFHYGAAKGGVLSMMRSIARQVWSEGVRVNAVTPGVVDTPMMRGSGWAVEPPKEVGRFGEPEEIAEVALFLASDGASFVTGQTLTAGGPMLTV
jgi:3-oxoacyl-[acyl-carrier protein] reductase